MENNIVISMEQQFGEVVDIILQAVHPKSLMKNFFLRLGM